MSFLNKSSRILSQKIAPYKLGYKLGVVYRYPCLKSLPVILDNQQFRYATCQQPTKKSKEEETYTKAPYYKDLERKQRHFQIDDGVPVYLKGGGMDKFLYQLTFFLIAFGLLDMVKWIYDMSYGKIKKSRK